MKDAKGHGSNSRGGAGAVTAPAYDGKPTWHGVMPGGGKVKNSAGNPIAYASPEAAKAGADWQHSAPVTPPGRPIGGSAVRGIADQPDTVTDKQAAASLAQGGAKSGAVPVHSGAGGWASSGAIPRGMGSRGGGPPSFETWPSSSTKRK